MKKSLVLIVSYLMVLTGFQLLAASNINNVDKPLKGEWNFSLKKVWQINTAGDELIGYIRQLAIAADGRIFASDVRTQKFYLLDKDGKLLTTFGHKGEGPGEIRRIGASRMYVINDKLIVLDSGRIHYFTQEGKFIRSVVNSLLPHYFINEDTFITAPLFARQAKDGIAHISLYNLKTNQQTQLYEYSFYDKSSVLVNGHTSTIIRTGVTPMMVTGYAPGTQTLYFGINDKYKINISNLKGEITGTFSLDRKPVKITKEMKAIDLETARKVMSPTEYQTFLSMKGPDHTTFFGAIEIHTDLIYVFVDEPYKPKELSHRILLDVFSPQGKYLYRGTISIQPGQEIGPSATIHDRYLYTSLINEEEDVVIAKYEISLPQ